MIVGPGNSGYGSKVPMDFFDGNHIKDGHHITVPRDNVSGNNAHMIQKKDGSLV
jgi:hypothetical protein